MKAYIIFDEFGKKTEFVKKVWEYIECHGETINIPEGTDFLNIEGGKQETACHRNTISAILVPRPKKVKKWNFLMRRHGGTGAFYISYPETSSHEAYKSRASVNDVVVTAIPQTQIEVEE